MATSEDRSLRMFAFRHGHQRPLDMVGLFLRQIDCWIGPNRCRSFTLSIVDHPVLGSLADQKSRWRRRLGRFVAHPLLPFLMFRPGCHWRPKWAMAAAWGSAPGLRFFEERVWYAAPQRRNNLRVHQFPTRARQRVSFPFRVLSVSNVTFAR